MKSYLLLLLSSLTFISCGDLLSEDDKGNNDLLSNTKIFESTNTKKDVTFSGYVQKAFSIQVNQKSFNDSEHFYTHFIEDLIPQEPQYQSFLKDSQIEIEGEYSLSRFGTQAQVYLSSEGETGHIFQAQTNQQAQFQIKVQSQALDETFKARLILRIGLKVTQKDQTVSHYCYILHSQKSNISITASSKPIIFDNFQTQLNTYQCEKYTEDPILPLPQTESSQEATSSSSQEATSSSSQEAPYQTTAPYISLTGTQYSLTLPFEEGESLADPTKTDITLTESLDKKSLIATLRPLKSEILGLFYNKVYELQFENDSWNIEGKGKTRISKSSSSNSGYESFTTKTSLGYITYFDEYYYGHSGYYYLYDSEMKQIEAKDKLGSSKKIFCNIRNNNYFVSYSRSIRTYYFDLNLPNPFFDPQDIGQVNFSSLGNMRNLACGTRHLYSIGNEGENVLLFNEYFIAQKSYGISKYLLPKNTLDTMKIIALKDKVYFYINNKNTLELYEIKFNN